MISTKPHRPLRLLVPSRSLLRPKEKTMTRTKETLLFKVSTLRGSDIILIVAFQKKSANPFPQSHCNGLRKQKKNFIFVMGCRTYIVNIKLG